ncbi:MAG TPA: hypothetical protein VN690_06255 [Terriglobales bacterium]|nr:hypothetical protein [Terriglobales bacterium]
MLRRTLALVSFTLLAGFASLPASAQIGAARVGFGLRASTLGIGGQFGVRISDSTNLRFGFNDFSYHHDLTHDGINYTGSLSLRSVSAQFDWFFWGPLHLSPGWLLYDGNQLSATAAVPGGNGFSLGGTNFTSSTSDPIAGSALLRGRRSAPLLTFGLGNLVPRGDGRFGVDFEFGVAYHGTPQSTLTLTGSACDTSGANCQPASSAQVQSSVQAEVAKLNNQVARYKFYPVLALGFHF